LRGQLAADLGAVQVDLRHPLARHGLACLPVGQGKQLAVQLALSKVAAFLLLQVPSVLPGSCPVGCVRSARLGRCCPLPACRYS
jgi:hypothetical protein